MTLPNFDHIKFDDVEPETEQVIDAEVIQDENQELPGLSDIFNEHGKVKCQVCGKYFGFITNSHLKTHNMTSQEYQDQFPNIPMHHEQHYGPQYTQEQDTKRALKKNYFVNQKGEVRDKETGFKSPPESALTVSPSKQNDIEKYVRSLVGYNCEDMFVILKAIALDKKVTINARLKAIEMIISYGLGRPVQRKTVDSTIKKLSVSIAGNLPKDMTPEDF